MEAEENYYDKYIRVLADLDNFKKRKDNEIKQVEKNAKKDIILCLLPIIDDILEGMKYDSQLDIVYRKCETTLTNNGIERYGMIGDKFDDSLHNAVITSSVGEVEEGCISEILKYGYKYDGEVIRYADVVVKYSGNTKN